MPNYHPPFTLTPELLGLVANIAEQIGRLTERQALNKSQALRRINRIRTIQGSLAIEAQITAILEGKRVLAPPRDIQEAQNAILAYEQLFQWQPHHEPHLLAAHELLMRCLMNDAGHYRSGGVGVMAGNEVIHIAPPAKQVPKLMADLLGWLAATPFHPLISSSIFHYEFEFIHPFADGNGRMGRLWQTLILSRWNELFAYLPVESLVHAHQAEYYQAIQQSTEATDCAPFIHFMLKAIHAALLEAQPDTNQKGSGKSSEKDTEISSEKILALIAKDTRISAKALAEKLGVSSRTIEKQLAKLKARGKLSRIGAAKGGYWQVNNKLKI